MDINTDKLIGRILNGEASPEDTVRFREWLNVNPSNKEEFHFLNSYWQAEVALEEEHDSLVSFEKLNKKLKLKKQRRILLISFTAAATLALLFGFSRTRFLLNEPNEKAIVQHYTHITDNNRSEILFVDGTKVMLNKNSKLTYSNEYGKTDRKVELIGEAYFEVSKDTIVPFIVETGESSIHVLGTKFNVKALSESTLLTATLVEGSIRFETTNQEVRLLPDQEVTFDRTTQRISLRTVNTEESVAWKNGVIKYMHIPFVELINKLEAIHNTRIILERKELKNPEMTVSATFEEGQSIDDVLRVITKSIPIKWSKTDNTYHIK